jgi:general secretion pathway protein D
MRPRTAVWAFVLTIGLAPAVPAQEPTPPQEQLVEFDFEDAELRIVLAALAEAAGLNIVFGQLPTRPVTLRTSRPIPTSEVRSLLESLASANGLELVAQDGFIRIVDTAPPEPVPGRAQPGRPAATGQQPGQRRLYVYHLSHARAEVVLRTLQDLFNLGGGFGAPVGAGDQLSLSEALRQQQVAPVTPDVGVAGPPAAGDQQGIPIGLESTVDIVEDPASNSILILATPPDYEVIEDALQALDNRPLQVLIEVVVAEVRHNRNTALGIDVNIPPRAGDDPEVGFRLQGLSAGDVALQILGIGSVDADVVITALASAGDVDILSRPILLAQNNSEARILVGDQRPFIQVFRALPTDNAVRDQVVQYRNVGTQLTIRPTISADGYINLEVAQEVSTATAETQFGAPVINTREAETDLLVKDGQTIVLGGLIDHQRSQTNSGVPLLKDIPLLGLLFRSTTYQVTKSEMLLLLTTHVIRSDEDLDETVRQLRGQMEQLEEALPDSIAIIPGPGARLDSARVRPDTLPARRSAGSADDPPERSRGW